MQKRSPLIKVWRELCVWSRVDLMIPHFWPPGNLYTGYNAGLRFGKMLGKSNAEA
jgi:hypothetical protein